MNSLFVSNLTSCHCRLFYRSIKNGKEARRVSFLALRSPRCAMDLSVGGDNFRYSSALKFPRMHVRDPYKLLGVTPDASEEEIRGARNFLLQQYAGHERSVEAIELAYEKIIMKSFKERKKAKINLKSKLRNKVEESPSWVKSLLSFVEVPTMDVVLRRLFLFGFMAVWSVMYSAQTGPAFQVFLSLLSCIYFLNEKMKDGKRACITGFGVLVVGWIVGATTVPLIPAYIFPPTWSLELLTSLNWIRLRNNYWRTVLPTVFASRPSVSSSSILSFRFDLASIVSGASSLQIFLSPPRFFPSHLVCCFGF